MLTGLKQIIYRLRYRKIFILFLFIFSHQFIQAQTCTVNQFAKGYLFDGTGAGFFFDRLPGGQYYFGGIHNYSMVMHKTDVDGYLLWSKSYDVTGSLYYSEYGLAAIDSNGNYFVSVDGDYIGMLDAGGNPVLAQQLKIPSINVFGTSIGVLPGNNKVLLVDDESAYGVEGYMLVCLSPDLSTIVWNKYFSGGTAYFRNFTIVGNKIYITGENSQKGTVLCFDGNTGDLLVKKTYTFNNKQTSVDAIYPYADGFIIQAKYYDNNTGTNKHVITRTDSNLELLNTYCLSTIYTDAALTLCVEPNGSFYGAWGSGLAYHLFYINRQDVILSHDLHMGGEVPRKLQYTPEGLTLFSQGNWFAVGLGTNQTALYFTRADGNGNLFNCITVPQPIQKTTVSCITEASPLTARDTSMITLLPALITASDHNPVPSQSCAATSICDTIVIQGNTTFCNNGDATFIARRNTGCYTPVNWTITGGNTNWQKLNDSTLSVQFLQSGTYTLIATISACQQIADTIEINVTVANQLLALGPDTTICPGNTILLNAHRGFTSYAWQDGSTDSIYHVINPGLYHVVVTDACGNVYRDTVSVAPHPPIPFDIGPDRIKCNNDTLHLSATAGFLNYTWSPSYNINSTASQNVIINPLTDTSYTIKAEKTPGCLAYDTIYISVYTSPTISFGPNISLCAGDSAVFNAGNNFLIYHWSNGNATPGITVHTAGSYSIDAITAEGCHSYDTISLMNVFPNPVVTLNHDPAICAGSDRILDAGNYSIYQWSTGSTAKTITVSNIGSYTVIVTDNNGCKGYDTTFITTLLPLPSHFLPLDTSVCSYESIEVQPLTGYQRYLWSNNSVSRSISITQPGTYWLQVTDNNNCKGKDTILVNLKECMKGFYMPNAFTPNRDNRNDLLRPFLFGNVKEYTFTIYNRWGQVVFHTKDLSKGWDGNFAGMLQDSNVFAWICSYQFEGEKQNTAKGTVVLIR
jgi:gliding motility-associated-like protein